MTIDYSISRWVDAVATRQWPREQASFLACGEAVPEVILSSRPLAEVHRLDLALFVVFEEAALRVSGALTRLAPTVEAMSFSAQQTLDEARHHELFRRRLELTSQALGLDGATATDAILIPPLRQFIDRCYEVADSGLFVEALTLMNLILEGMAYPLYSYEERYWQPLDPFLAQLIRSAFIDETRHVAFGTAIVQRLLHDVPEHRNRVITLCREARMVMNEIFRYYIRKFVGLFDAVARRHGEHFADIEIAPGQLIVDTPYQEQVSIIHSHIDTEHTRLLGRAGLA
ncbi:MAG: hypothetical protein FJ147_04325 [Deltaproteobacteria bacterium]|nr:hypothetical protein [Deltaproteobacteria bacterium]